VKQRLVGTYRLGAFNVTLYLRDGTGGEFYYAPDEKNPPRMNVGQEGGWHQVVGTLIHEAAEFSLSNMRCRYELDENQPSSDRFHFFANHYQFSTMSLDVGMFVAQSLPDLSKAFGAWPKGAR
jgi:hypothetical protein